MTVSWLTMALAMDDGEDRHGDAHASYRGHGSDAELIHRIRTGDYAAFEWAFREYAAALATFITRYGLSADDAQDAVQEIFFGIWRNRESWHVSGSLERHLFASARNRAIDRLRHDAVRRRWREQAKEEPSEVTDTPDGNLDEADAAAALVRALATLPDRRREVCTLRWVDRLSYLEIAQRLGISEKTVKTQLARAVDLVRDRLREYLI